MFKSGYLPCAATGAVVGCAVFFIIVFSSSSAPAGSAGAACDCGPQTTQSNARNNAAANAAAAIRQIQENYQRSNEQLQHAADQALSVLRSESSASGDSDESNDTSSGQDTSNDDSSDEAPSYSAPVHDNSAAAAALRQTAAQQAAAQAQAQFDAQLDSTDAADSSAVASTVDQQLADEATDRQDAANTAAAINQQLGPSDSLLGGVPQDSEVFKPYDAYASDDPPPNTTVSSTISEWLDSARTDVKDALTGIVQNTKSLIGTVADSPQVQWALQDEGDLTTIPDMPTLSGPGPTQVDAVYAQSAAGFGDLVKGWAQGPIGFAHSVYVYNTKMVNKGAVLMGLARQEFLIEPEPLVSSEPSGNGQ